MYTDSDERITNSIFMTNNQLSQCQKIKIIILPYMQCYFIWYYRFHLTKS